VPRPYDLEERIIGHACALCRVAEGLPLTVLGRRIANQLIRSATSPAANYGEAQGAESRRDFGHKLKLCLKELRESRVWLRLIERMHLGADAEVEPALKENDELIAIFVTSIRTTLRTLPGAARHRAPRAAAGDGRNGRRRRATVGEG
jgi:four helix bundle protein